MRTNDKKNTSAKKKLIPAVAMLTTSAIMLSTATYAWFTLNKTVEVDGLQMTATTADALEISLGGVTKASNGTTRDNGTLVDDLVAQPNDTTDVSWTNLINVGEYYDTVKYIKPSSSVDGVNFWEATDATNGGKTATKFNKVNQSDTALTKRTSLTLGGTLSNVTSKDTSTSSDNYVKFPVHLRTSKLASKTDETATVYCTMSITDPDDSKDGTPEGDLYKAVRVAFVPITYSDNTASEANAASIIMGADTDYYTTNQAVNSANDRSSVTVTKTVDDSNSLAKFDAKVPIKLAATAGEYGHSDFMVYVWLEGESTSCYDANSAQDWNIDFAFSLEENDLPTKLPSTTTTAATGGN